MPKNELLELITSAKNKDRKAQTKLINRFWTDVFSFVMKKVRNENIADEITVNIFSKVLSKLDLYDSEFQFKTWVLTIAQNTIIDFWRKKNRENIELDFVLDEGRQDENLKNRFAKSPEELLISEEDQQKIRSIVESMDANYQDMIRLRFFEEKSIKEISEELNISVSNTKIRIMRAKKILAQLLKDNMF
ncbi:MAG: RNA polymerase sigma factor [Flavobacteriaceae bacterium]|jgi:RNA polymerase sigma-70 factor (ECF subfamily)|nr:RNA polymerase sigma factor [Flavobacteriaceae bacterium]